MHHTLRIVRILFVGLLTFLSSCRNTIDLPKEETAIKKLLQEERKAHFARDADLFIGKFADSAISVNKGKVTINSRETNKQLFSSYFNKVQFIKWDDIADPIIRFSNDGLLAYAIVQKNVILSYTNSQGRLEYDTTYFAWTSIYRKQNGKWELECNTSTNK